MQEQQRGNTEETGGAVRPKEQGWAPWEPKDPLGIPCDLGIPRLPSAPAPACYAPVSVGAHVTLVQSSAFEWVQQEMYLQLTSVTGRSPALGGAGEEHAIFQCLQLSQLLPLEPKTHLGHQEADILVPSPCWASAAWPNLGRPVHFLARALLKE